VGRSARVATNAMCTRNPLCALCYTCDQLLSVSTMTLPKHYVPTFAERYPIALLAGVVDFLLIVAGSYVAHWLRFGDWFMLDHYLVATMLVAVVLVVCQMSVGTYLSWRGRRLWAQLGRMLAGWLLALAVVASIAVLLKVAENYSRIWLVSTLAVALGFVT